MTQPQLTLPRSADILSSLLTPSPVRAVSSSLLQMRKLKFREGETFASRHTAKWGEMEFGPTSVDSRAYQRIRDLSLGDVRGDGMER